METVAQKANRLEIELQALKEEILSIWESYSDSWCDAKYEVAETLRAVGVVIPGQSGKLTLTAEVEDLTALGDVQSCGCCFELKDDIYNQFRTFLQSMSTTTNMISIDTIEVEKQ